MGGISFQKWWFYRSDLEMTFIWQKKKKKEFFERTMATDGNRRYSLEADLKMNQTNSSWQPLPSSSWTIFQPQHDIWWSSKTVHNLINMRNISLFNITQTSPNKSWQGGRPPNWGLSLNTQNFLPPVHITSANLIRLYSNFSLNNIIFFSQREVCSYWSNQALPSNDL